MGHAGTRWVRHGVAAAALAAAGAMQVPAVQAQNNTLVMAVPSAPKGVDGDVWLPGTLETVIQVYEGLTEYAIVPGADGRRKLDPGNMKPHLAESWTVSPDGKTYVFKLRNAKSFRGNELTADDVVFGYEKSVAQKRTGLFLKTVGLIDKVEKVSDKEVKFTLTSPNRSFLRVLYLYTPSVYDSRVVKENAKADDPYATQWVAQNTAGYGAYHMTENRPGEGAQFVRNPNYFGPKPFFDRVVYREVPSAANRPALVQQGVAQWADQVPIQAIPELMKDKRVKVEKEAGSGTAHLVMNRNYKPFDDVRVRKAMIHAMDYEAVNKTVFHGLGTRSRSNLLPSFPGYVAANTYETDYAKAKQLLSEAGYPNGLEVTLEYAENQWWEEALSIQFQQSAANAGIKVNLKRIPNTEMNSRRGVGQRTLPFFPFLSNPFVLEPSYAYYLTLHSKGSNNAAAFYEKDFDALIDAMVIEPDEEKYKKMVEEGQKRIAAEALYVDTFYPGVFGVMAPCIEGWIFRPVPYVLWRDLSCKKT